MSHPNQKRATAALWALLFGALLAAQPRQDLAIFFPVTDYAKGSGWDPLAKTLPECKAIAADLEQLYGFKTEVLPNQTKQQIEDKLYELSQRPFGPQDQLLLFFSMHGNFEEIAKGGSLIPYGGTQDRRTWLLHATLDYHVSVIPCPHIAIALDACYSGTFGGARGIPSGPAGNGCADKIRNALQNKSRLYLTAGGKEKVPADSDFARKWRSALGTLGGEDGLLTFPELQARLSEATPTPKWGTFGDDLGGSFVLVPKNGCGSPVVSNDRDGDGVPDAADKCADTWGSGPDGCPLTTPKTDDGTADLAAWRSAKTANSKTAYEGYLRQYPNGEFKDNANTALRRLETEELARRDNTAWEIATEKNATEAYQKYLLDWPNGRHAAEAKEKATAKDKTDDGLVFVQGGTFTMGCTNEQKDCDDDEKPAHQVTLSDFYIGKHEVTQKLWQDVMSNNPSNFKNCDQCPVEQVSWDEVQTFLQKLNTKYPGRNYRLPTEAEWEYAAREGGKAVLFGNGKNVLDPSEVNFDARASYKTSYSVAGTYRQKTTPVGTFAPNALGLYDMSGNVYEWCSDWKGTYPSSAQTNPTGSASGSYRVIRGGSWHDDPQYCRVAYRSHLSPGYRSLSVGFRLARTK